MKKETKHLNLNADQNTLIHIGAMLYVNCISYHGTKTMYQELIMNLANLLISIDIYIYHVNESGILLKCKAKEFAV